MRVGNILPGERVTRRADAWSARCRTRTARRRSGSRSSSPRATSRATPLAGGSVGDGYAVDTDAVPDASRITPPVLLPGFPNPVRLAIGVDIDPAGLPLGEVRSSLHAVVGEGGTGRASSRASGSTATSSCAWRTARRTRPATR